MSNARSTLYRQVLGLKDTVVFRQRTDTVRGIDRWQTYMGPHEPRRDELRYLISKSPVAPIDPDAPTAGPEDMYRWLESGGPSAPSEVTRSSLRMTMDTYVLIVRALAILLTRGCSRKSGPVETALALAADWDGSPGDLANVSGRLGSQRR